MTLTFINSLFNYFSVESVTSTFLASSTQILIKWRGKPRTLFCEQDFLEMKGFWKKISMCSYIYARSPKGDAE